MITTSGQEGFNENTLFKVYDVLRAAGLTEEQSREAINEMQNKGILFRERTEVNAKASSGRVNEANDEGRCCCGVRHRSRYSRDVR